MSITKSKAAAELRQHFETQPYAHADSLQLQCYGEGFAWFESKDAAEPDDSLYTITERGRDLCRRWRAEEATFRRGPRVSETLP